MCRQRCRLSSADAFPEENLLQDAAMSRDIKKKLRAEALARRDALDPQWRIEASLGIAETGARLLAVEPGLVVSGFWPMRSEVDVRPLLAALADRGARICLPAI